MTGIIQRGSAFDEGDPEESGGPSASGASRSADILVIWNPEAGGGAASDDERGKRRASIEDALGHHGLDAELVESNSEDETARRIDDAIASGVRTIVAAGGDGTVRSIAFRLLGREVDLGILPMGTAMNVARSLDIPLELDAAVEVLVSGYARHVDVGEARGQPFLEIASIGLGAEVLAGATEAQEGRLRRAFEMLRRAVRYPRTRVRLQLDGREVRGRVPSVAIANGRFTGRGMELAPEARLDDGRFDVLLFEGFGPVQLLVHLVRVLLGRTDDPRIRRYRAATVRMSAHRPLPIRLDSQDIGTTPVEIVTRRGALRVIAPRRPAPSGTPRPTNGP